MNTFIVVCLLAPFVLSLGGGYLVRRLAPRWGLVDTPNVSGLNHKTHTEATPLGGGLAVFAALAVCLLSVWLAARFSVNFDRFLSAEMKTLLSLHRGGLLESGPRLLFLLSMGAVLVTLGLIDDRWGISWKFRLGVEFLVAVATVWQGWRLSLFMGDSVWAVLITGTISVFWIVGLINSFNMLDNMNGLSAGVGTIASLFFAAAVLGRPEPGQADVQWFVGGLFLILAGALLGFLMHNWPRAKLFLGDCGSYLIGYILATGALGATFSGPGAAPWLILAPLCILAIPLYDISSVLIIRIANGASPFVGDTNHLSHRLVRRGMTRTQSVAVIWLMAGTLGAGSLILPRTDAFGAVVVGFITASMIAIIALLEHAWDRKSL